MTKNLSPESRQAIIYGRDDTSNEFNFQRLSSSEEDDTHDEVDLGRFHSYSLGLGLTVGIFMQLSTLGANFLVLTLLNGAVMKNHQIDVIALPVIYSVLTLTMALLVLGFLKNLLSLSYSSGRWSGPADKKFLEDVLAQMECRFITGALVGVCLSWTATDLILGLDRQVTFAAVTLFLTVLAGYVFGFCSGNRGGEFRKDNEMAQELLARQSGYCNAIIV